MNVNVVQVIVKVQITEGLTQKIAHLDIVLVNKCCSLAQKLIAYTDSSHR